MEPFKYKELIQKKKLLGILDLHKKENSIIEINNILSCHEIEDLSPKNFDLIKEKYGENIFGYITKELVDLLEKYISFNIQNLELAKIDFSSFQKFTYLFHINECDLEKITMRDVLNRFEKEVIQIIDSKETIKDNEKKLEQIQKTLNIPEKSAKEILDKKRIEKVKDAIRGAISDGRYSPEEEKNFLYLAERLNVSISYEDEMVQQLEKAKRLWKIENEPLPVIEPGIFLQKNEKCFYAKEADLYEYKRVTRRVGYAGPQFRLKITKGFYYRLGQLDVAKQTEDVLKEIDKGHFYLTNRRVIFVGNNKTYNIRISKIIDFELFSDGIRIIKDTGNNQLISFEDDTQVIGALLARVITDYQ